jgi:hypothetical protein
VQRVNLLLHHNLAKYPYATSLQSKKYPYVTYKLSFCLDVGKNIWHVYTTYKSLLMH